MLFFDIMSTFANCVQTTNYILYILILTKLTLKKNFGSKYDFLNFKNQIIF